MTMRSKPKPYLIAYDIGEPRRLQRVHRLLKNQAIALQYSVFIALMNKAECEELTQALSELIDESVDDVRLYPLPQRPKWHAWGKGLWPDGITITGLKLPKQYH